MFPSKKRFPRALFPAALKTGKRFLSPHLSVIIPRDGEGYAVVVPKKVANLAVERHKIKRRIFSALRGDLVSLPPALIVFPKSSVSSVSYQDIKTEIIDLLSKIYS
ncbi:MAG: ribonuclease P protein component [Candidatus Paceibacterota bacterium]